MRQTRDFIGRMRCRVIYARAVRQELGHSPDGPNPRRSRSILDVSSLSTVSVLSFDPIRVRALCVEELQLGWISSGYTLTCLI